MSDLPARQSHDRRGTEKYLGITQRISPIATPWHGEIRVRYTDFQVFEINKDGQVIHLQEIGLSTPQKEPAALAPVPQPIQGTESPSNGDHSNKNGENASVSPDDTDVLVKLVGQAFAEQLVELYRVALERTPGDKATESATSEPIGEKSTRTKVHEEIRRIFGSKLDTTTDSSGAIIAKTANLSRQRQRGRQDNRRGNKDRGEYLHFTLYKENRDTMDCLGQIARLLRVKPAVVNVAGTKDRRAATTQRCSVRYQTAETLSRINSNLRGMETGDYQYHNEPLHLGQHSGNEFVITIKDCALLGQPCHPSSSNLDAIQAAVESAVNHMAKNGWINYFGHQRFGTHAEGTHHVGKLILTGDFEGAVNSILSYNEDIATRAQNGEVPTEASARDNANRDRACMIFLTSGNAEEALKYMPRRFAGETSIIRHLSKNESMRHNYTGAISGITKGLRSMYLHAYQSYVWNHAASKRWALYGSRVIKGDLITDDSETKTAAQDQDSEEVVYAVPDEDEDSALKARPLSQEEADSGRYTVHDIVLPSPGYDVIYPGNEIGHFYEEFMGQEENGSLDPHNMRRRQREFSLPGRYRKLMAKFLKEPSFSVQLYADDNEQMHPTDLDLIKQRRLSGKRGFESSGQDSSDGPENKKLKMAEALDGMWVDQEPPHEVSASEQAGESTKDDSGEHLAEKVAVIVNFQLGKSAYATVVLWELMGDAPKEDVPTSGI